jgi:hypothetical protein
MISPASTESIHGCLGGDNVAHPDDVAVKQRVMVHQDLQIVASAVVVRKAKQTPQTCAWPGCTNTFRDKRHGLPRTP